MKIVGYILLACLLLASLKAFAVIAAMAALLALLLGACFRTRQTFGLMAALIMLSIACSSSGPSKMVAGAVLVWLALTRRPDPGGG